MPGGERTGRRACGGNGGGGCCPGPSAGRLLGGWAPRMVPAPANPPREFLTALPRKQPRGGDYRATCRLELPEGGVKGRQCSRGSGCSRTTLPRA